LRRQQRSAWGRRVFRRRLRLVLWHWRRWLGPPGPAGFCALRLVAGGPVVSCVQATGFFGWMVVLSFSSRQCRWSGAALVVGSGVGGCLLAVPWWCFGRCRTSPGGPVGVVWMAGSLFGGVCCRSGFFRAKASTVGGIGGGALGRRSPC
jgi:hypothetical protein